METERISLNQWAGAVWAAVLAPAALLPGMSARVAGRGGWLTVLLALPGVLAACWLVGRLTRRGERGLGEVFCARLGGGLGRVLILIYMVWGLLLACAGLGRAGQRLLITARGGNWFYLSVLGIMAVWMTWGKPGAFARAAELFWRVLAVLLGAVVLLTLFQVKGQNLWPLWTQDVLPVLKGTGSALGVLCHGIYGGFLLGGASESRGRGGNWLGRMTGGCVLLTLLQYSALGNLGPELTAALEHPVLSLSKHVGVEGAFQRVESLVSAVLLLGDLALLALLLWSGRRMMALLYPCWSGRAVAATGGLLALAGGALACSDPLRLVWLDRVAIPIGNLIVGICVPGGVFLLTKEKAERQGEGTSCGRLSGERQI